MALAAVLHLHARSAARRLPLVVDAWAPPPRGRAVPSRRRVTGRPSSCRGGRHRSRTRSPRREHDWSCRLRAGSSARQREFETWRSTPFRRHRRSRAPTPSAAAAAEAHAEAVLLVAIEHDLHRRVKEAERPAVPAAGSCCHTPAAVRGYRRIVHVDVGPGGGGAEAGARRRQSARRAPAPKRAGRARRRQRRRRRWRRRRRASRASGSRSSSSAGAMQTRPPPLSAVSLASTARRSDPTSKRHRGRPAAVAAVESARRRARRACRRARGRSSARSTRSSARRAR